MANLLPVDASGILPDGRTFNGPAELRRALLAQLPLFAQNVTQKMMTYSLGRGLSRYDKIVAKDITGRLAESDYPFQSIIFEIVESPPFQQRRGEITSTQNSVKPIERAQK